MGDVGRSDGRCAEKWWEMCREVMGDVGRIDEKCAEK